MLSAGAMEFYRMPDNWGDTEVSLEDASFPWGGKESDPCGRR